MAVFYYILLVMKHGVNTANTVYSGIVRFLVYQISDDPGVYYATALECNLTVSADNDDEALLELREQLKEYIATARKENAPELLNQNVDEDLERAWLQMTRNEGQEAVPSHLKPLFAATSPIAAAVSV